ncbi:hypothetical protein [Umezawaea sp. Da 62-37]|uniref:hypothetical protein n=1 Tax=Umezawaea sp. Da 62-37 TaxID=3075927 RepID=UPI0028F6CA23|nr:hypothetical protein [Umezawaea sp. Da 62-37]WNV85342.1 hypothetical protein RM788_45705 [Umezawaea sp. Da 62-37]
MSLTETAKVFEDAGESPRRARTRKGGVAKSGLPAQVPDGVMLVSDNLPDGDLTCSGNPARMTAGTMARRLRKAADSIDAPDVVFVFSTTPNAHWSSPVSRRTHR